MFESMVDTTTLASSRSRLTATGPSSMAAQPDVDFIIEIRQTVSTVAECAAR